MPVNEGTAEALDFRCSPLPIRDELVAAHRRAWARLAAPGEWWTGEVRVAIAKETRAATDCELCKDRRAALSPYVVTGTRAGDLGDAEFVETVGVIATVIAIDTFCDAMGIPRHALPAPVAGEPRRRRPAGYADAFFTDESAFAAARERLQREVGEEASVDAAGVLAIFNAVVRIADATGIPLEETKARMSVDIRDALGLGGT